ncbi:MAG TPA: FKBP-type peptidyl-prolyl cis-trans isomerase [Rhizomicrobium sp.]|nr:FKBP-type peptidyl-prolyl cis-trans isomerase [Rhizomicrobium sp.]
MSRFGAFAAAVLVLFVVTPAWADDPSLSIGANQAFLAANAKKEGVEVRPSGLQYRIISNGFGAQPKPGDSVDVYYTGSLINGKVFDKTEPGLPATFTAGKGKLIPGWDEALQIMREGDHWQLVIPADLAYGARGAGGVIPPNQTLVFDMQLVKVTPAPKDQQDQDQDQDQSSQ